MRKIIIIASGILVFVLSFPISIFSQNEDYSQKIKLFNLLRPTATKTVLPPLPSILLQQNNNINKKNTDNNTNVNITKNNFVYYSQLDPKYKDIKMDNAFCGVNNPATIGNAGCGPTTVAMIIASYINKSINPIDIVKYYDKNGWLGCGTSISAARDTLSYYGFKITPDSSILSISEMKKMIDNGWTLMALATITYHNFNEEKKMGHYFWIVNIDEKNNVLVYDPWWSYQKNLPTNNNQHIKVEYRQVFGIKLK